MLVTSTSKLAGNIADNGDILYYDLISGHLIDAG